MLSFTLLAVLLVAVAALEPAANEFCDEVKLTVGPKVEVVGTWKNRVYSDATVVCNQRDEVCRYKKNSDDTRGIELIVESLIWSRSQDSTCDSIEAAKFRLEPAASRGQIALIVAIALAGAAVLTVFFGCLAYFSNPESYWGRKLRSRGPRNSPPPESPTIELPTVSTE